jgi:uncharacterized protein
MANQNKQDSAFSADTAMEPYWQAANEGKLLLKKCSDCGKTHYYPRPICPFCMSDNTEWLEASGEGKIYSWSVQRRPEPAFAIAFVTLAEGPTILTNIVDADLESIAINQSVKLKYETRDEQPVPVFSPS